MSDDVEPGTIIQMKIAAARSVVFTTQMGTLTVLAGAVSPREGSSGPAQFVERIGSRKTSGESDRSARGNLYNGKS